MRFLSCLRLAFIIFFTLMISTAYCDTPAPAVLEGAEGSLTIEGSGSDISIFAVSVDSHELLTKLARFTGIKLIVDDTVKRTITVNIRHKKPDELLKLIIGTYGLSSQKIKDVTLISEGIPNSASSYLLSDIASISTQNVLAADAKELLPVFLKDLVKTNLEQNAVILSAPAEVLAKFREDIGQFDTPASQIMLKVMMVEFTDTTSQEFSFNWLWSNAHHSVGIDSSVGEIIYHTVAMLPTSFSANLRFLVSQGKANIHASPSIATLSGQKASIFIGKQKYLSTPIAFSSSTFDTSYRNSIDAGVNLELTPYTGGEGEIIVEVHPEISVLSAPDAATGLPDKSTRRANTTVRVKDGETIILGGLNQDEEISTRTKIPLLGDLPLIGGLFKSKNINHVKTEMVIFITPHILGPNDSLSADQVKEIEQKYFRDLKEKPKKK